MPPRRSATSESTPVFRLHQRRVLELLGNEQLYGTPFAAVRELLQNAFDAVRAKVAHRRLGMKDGAAPEAEMQLGAEEHVRLTLWPGSKKDEWLLICDDSGTGLTERAIRRQFLYSGAPRSADSRKLEAACSRRGFQTGMTGQFGLGVLSYFMLAEEVVLLTARSAVCPDSDAAGWKLTLKGVGEACALRRLRRSPVPSSGTRIIWRLRKEHTTDIAGFADRLDTYLCGLMLRLPCRFSFRVASEVHGEEKWWGCGPGWFFNAEAEKQRILQSWKEPDELDWHEHLHSSTSEVHLSEQYVEPHRMKEWRRLMRQYPRDLAAARKALRVECRDVPLPDGAGCARLIAAWFDLPKGRAFYFPADRPTVTSFPTGGSEFTSYKGMTCEIREQREPGDDSWDGRKLWNNSVVSLDLDIVAAAGKALAIHRGCVRLPPQQLDGITEVLEAAAKEWLDEISSGSPTRYYHDINLAMQDRPLILRGGSAWYSRRLSRAEFHLAPVGRPFTCCRHQYWDYDSLCDPAGRAVYTLRPDSVYTLENIFHSRPVPRISFIADGFKLYALNTGYCRRGGPSGQLAIPVWTDDEPPLPPGTFVAPPEWQEVLLMYLHYSARPAINCQHWLVRQLPPEYWDHRFPQAFRRDHQRKVDFLTLLDEARTPQEAAIALLESALAFEPWLTPDNAWLNYAGKHPARLQRVWQLASKNAEAPRNSRRIVLLSDDHIGELSPDPKPHVLPRRDQSFLAPVTDSKWLLQAEDFEMLER